MRILCRVVAALPPFHVAVAPVTARRARWLLAPGAVRSGLPQLRTLRVSFVGFRRPSARGRDRHPQGRDGRGHDSLPAAVCSGVSRSAAWSRSQSTAGATGRSMAADNTSGFNCRYGVRAGPEALVGACLRRGDRREHDREPIRAGQLRQSGGGPPRTSSAQRFSRRDGRCRRRASCAPFASVGWLWGRPVGPGRLTTSTFSPHRRVKAPRAGRSARGPGKTFAHTSARAIVIAPPATTARHRPEQRSCRTRFEGRRARLRHRRTHPRRR